MDPLTFGGGFNVFNWDQQVNQSFQEIKALIEKANETPLRYYARTLPVTVQADTSLRGLGACLIQQLYLQGKGPAGHLCQQEPHGHRELDLRVDYITFMKLWIEKLKDSTQRDPILRAVYQLTQQGWPHQWRHVPHAAKRYWDFRDKLSNDDGLVLK